MTGFLKCGSCGANRVKERADWLEDRLLSELRQAVMKPEAVDYALCEFERQLTASRSDLSNQVGRMRQRSEQIQQELRNLVTTTATCGPSPALIEGINEREQELKGINRQLLTTEPDSVSSQVGRIRQFVTERLGNIRELLSADVQRAKAELAKQRDASAGNGQQRALHRGWGVEFVGSRRKARWDGCGGWS
jgi:hypothetical protein